MELLNQEGNIVDNAAQIIDDHFNYSSIGGEKLAPTNESCSPSESQIAIASGISSSISSSNSDFIDILKYEPKIYGELSRKISKLSQEFMPFAECIIAFIDQWCNSGGAGDGRKYGYEICSTTRSWYVQQNIITGFEYKENGLSWSLYKNALSVNVYYLEEDQLSETSGNTSFVKKTINFEDNSARNFIESAQKWFSLHKTRTGKNIRVYGVYPDTESAIRKGKHKLQEEYLSSDETVFWTGLFSTYSNFTTWEYHPGLMPNEVWKARQSFLNTSFVSDGNEDLLSRIENQESITYQEARKSLKTDPLSTSMAVLGLVGKPSLKKYLSTTLEIMEEDFISLYNLKVKINTSSTYEVESLFKWARQNPYSLAQTQLLHQINGDVENSVLFYILSTELENDISYDENGVPFLINESRFKIVGDEESEYYLTCYDMFGDLLRFNFSSTHKLPCDYMPDSSTFDLIDLSNNVADSDGLNIFDSDVGGEISNMSSILNKNENGINEFGPLSSLEIDPRKLLYNADTLADSIFRSKNYNEMITPPDSFDTNKSHSVLDVTQIGKRLVADLTSKVNEMIQPDKI